ncbi:MAG: DUF1189 domain-containing protein [Sedimentisphaerales bacterium]
MKKFSIIHVPLLSFFSGELYQDVGLNWKGIGFGYLFLLLVICTIPGMFKFQKGLSNFIDEQSPKFVNQVPKITIEKGKVRIDRPQPYYITAPDSNKVVAIIDTTGQIQSLDDANVFVLLTKTKLLSRQNKAEVHTYDLAGVQHFELDRDKVMNWLHVGQKLLIPMFYPFVLLGSFIFRIVQSLIYAAIGLAFAGWCKTKLSYLSLIRLSVVAMTPCIIVGTVLEYASVKLPLAGLWFFLATMVFLLYGIKACSQITEPATIEDELKPGNRNQSPGY